MINAFLTVVSVILIAATIPPCALFVFMACRMQEIDNGNKRVEVEQKLVFDAPDPWETRSVVARLLKEDKRRKKNRRARVIR